MTLLSLLAETIRQNLLSECMVAQEEFMMHSDSVLATAFSRDSEMLATASQDGQIKVCEAIHESSNAQSAELLLLCCSQVWKLRTGQVLRRYDKAHSLGVTSLRFGRDGTQLLSGSFDTTLKYESA